MTVGSFPTWWERKTGPPGVGADVGERTSRRVDHRGEIREKRIFRAHEKERTLSRESLSPTTVWKIVLQYARNTGIRELTPHDLRRTRAKLCRLAGGDLEQI